MRKTITRAILGAAGVLALTGPVAAQAATTAPAAPAAAQAKAAPASSGTTWTDNKYSYAAADFNGATEWEGDASGGSPISAASNCMSGTGFCYHKDPGNGNECLTWQSSDNETTDVACSGLARQYWAVQSTTQGGGGYTWQNYYGDTVLGCNAVWTQQAAIGSVIALHCPNGAGGAYGFSQVWKGN